MDQGRIAAAARPRAATGRQRHGPSRRVWIWGAVVSLLVLAMILPSALTTMHALNLLDDNARTQSETESRRTVNLLADSMSIPIWNLVPETGFALANAMLDDPRIVMIKITSTAQGEVFNQERPASDPGAVTYERRDVIHNGAKIGSVAVGIDQGRFAPTQRNEKLRFMASVVFQVLMGLVLLAAVVRISGRLHEQATLEAANIDLREEVDKRRDLTQRLAESEGRLLSILDNLPAAVSIFDLDFRYLLVNAEFARLQGMDMTDIVGKRHGETGQVLPPSVAHKRRTMHRVVETRKPVIEERKIGFANGEVRYFLTVCTPVTDLAGRMIGLASVSTDMTDQKQRDRQVLQNDKLATIGRMATGIAHELNQPLNNIRLISENLIGAAEGDDGIDRPDAEKLTQIQSQIDRMSEIINHMRQFARKDSEDTLPFDPMVAVENAIDLIGRQLRNDHIALDADLRPPAGQVMGSVIRLEQVTLNLLANARDAIQARAGTETGVEGRIEVRAWREGANGPLVLTVSDNGGGIPAAARAHIFDPFFTTKEIGSGTGLGLSITRDIIASMNGTIQYAPTDDGSCFKVTLPLTA